MIATRSCFAPSLREWPPPDHLAWFVLDAVEGIDLSGLYGVYREDVAFRVIAANRIPDHATIARFRARHKQALAAPSRRCWRCARAAVVSVGVVTLDGSLLAGDASPGATRSYASIRSEVERMLGEAARGTPPRMRGEARWDEPPAELVDSRSRREPAPPQSGAGACAGR